MLPEGTYVSEWLSFEELVAKSWLKRGDLIEFNRFVKDSRGEYKHWAIYSGTKVDQSGQEEAQIIHFSTPHGDFGSDGCSVDEKMIKQKASSFLGNLKLFRSGGINAFIMKSNLKEAAGKDLIRVNNDMDKTHKPYGSETILERAERTLKRAEELGECKYHLLINNCEHFVRFCRYGNRVSFQVEFIRIPADFCATMFFTHCLVFFVASDLITLYYGELTKQNVFSLLFYLFLTVAGAYIIYDSPEPLGLGTITYVIVSTVFSVIVANWIDSILMYESLMPLMFSRIGIYILFFGNVWLLYNMKKRWFLRDKKE